mgnify:CR=1 FL=1
MERRPGRRDERRVDEQVVRGLGDQGRSEERGLVGFRRGGGVAEAEAAAALVPITENSELFSEAAFTSPVTRDSPGGKERFSMRARIGTKPAGEERAP